MHLLEFEEYKGKLNNLKPTLTELRDALRLDDAKNEIEKLEAESASEGYWNDLARSQAAQKRLRTLQHKVEGYQKLETSWEDLYTICEMALEEDDESMLPELREGFEKPLSAGIPLLAGTALVFFSYRWKHNTLLSIALGTAGYMLALRLL